MRKICGHQAKENKKGGKERWEKEREKRGEKESRGRVKKIKGSLPHTITV